MLKGVKEEICIPLDLNDSLFIGINDEKINKLDIAPMVSCISVGSIREKMMNMFHIPIKKNEQIEWIKSDPDDDIFNELFNNWNKYNNAELALSKIFSCDDGELNNKFSIQIENP